MIVLDTNVVSELMKPSPSAAVAGWARAFGAGELHTTSVTVAEILYGIERLAEGRRKRTIGETARRVFSTFAEHVLPFDAAAAVEHAALVSAREHSGAPIDGLGAQIAAICRAKRGCAGDPQPSRLPWHGRSDRPLAGRGVMRGGRS